MRQKAEVVSRINYIIPKTHRFLFGSLVLFTVAVTLWQPPSVNEFDEPAFLSFGWIKDRFTNRYYPSATEPLDVASPAYNIPSDEIDQKIDSQSDVNEYIISAGDTLSSILTQYGIDIGDVNLLSKSSVRLRHLKVGQQVTWNTNEDGQLINLTWVVSRKETRVYERTAAGKFEEKIIIKQGEWKNQVLKGTVNGSFVLSARSAGLNSSEILAVTKALQWQMDFRKLRKGDKFAALFSREYLNGKSENSQLVAVRLNSGGKDYYAVKAEDGKFYNSEGSGLARGFLRYPSLKPYRVSSHFNLRRLNPVTGYVTPHLGVDFAMPIGTPVLSTADGEIIYAKNNDGAAGNIVAVRHGRQYTTRYMHLSTILVKSGQKVKRGDKIALSGNTGRSTGPHLHYELWINNKAVNPLTANLPRTDRLSGKERNSFLAQVKQIKPQLQFD